MSQPQQNFSDVAASGTMSQQRAILNFNSVVSPTTTTQQQQQQRQQQRHQQQPQPPLCYHSFLRSVTSRKIPSFVARRN
jgi:hypothetical protein